MLMAVRSTRDGRGTRGSIATPSFPATESSTVRLAGVFTHRGLLANRRFFTMEGSAAITEVETTTGTLIVTSTLGVQVRITDLTRFGEVATRIGALVGAACVAAVSMVEDSREGVAPMEEAVVGTAAKSDYYPEARKQFEAAIELTDPLQTEDLVRPEAGRGSKNGKINTHTFFRAVPAFSAGSTDEPDDVEP